MQPNRRFEHLYAIIRVDGFQESDVCWENKITVTRIVRSEEAARVEVDRLNQLNAAKGCVYFWQVTRLEESCVPSESTASVPAQDGRSG